MGLKIVHINREEVCKDAEAKAMWENVLKPKWEQQARERGAKLLAELKGAKTRPQILRHLKDEGNSRISG